MPLPLAGQALKLIGPQIIKEIHVHCGKLERKSLMICWQPLLILWCFLQVCLFACLLACSISFPGFQVIISYAFCPCDSFAYWL